MEQNFYGPLRKLTKLNVNKINTTPNTDTFSRFHHCFDVQFCVVLLFYFSIIKIPLESVTLRLDRCIFKTKHVACKITITDLTWLLIWSNMPLFSTALLLPWRGLSVLKRVSIYNPNFVVKKSSHVTLEFSLKKYFLTLGKYVWPVRQLQKVDEASHPLVFVKIFLMLGL